MLDISVDFLSLLERGRNAPSFETLDKMAKRLRVPVAQLFTFDRKMLTKCHRQAAAMVQRRGARNIQDQDRYFSNRSRLWSMMRFQSASLGFTPKSRIKNSTTDSIEIRPVGR